MTEWTSEEIDNVYNGGAGVGLVMAFILEAMTGFNRNKGMAKHLTTGFTGVGIGGTLAYVYLYFQGVYEEGFVPVDYRKR